MCVCVSHFVCCKFCYTSRSQPTIMMIMHYAEINWAQCKCGDECACVRGARVNDCKVHDAFMVMVR